MARKANDLTGQTFGRLTVIERAENKGRYVAWRCRCSCENKTEIVVVGDHLKRGHTKSCGCLQVEKTKESKTKHGLSYDKTYHIWNGIKARCFNPNNKYYKDYGGRGITMYPAWINDFAAFYEYVSTLENYGKPGYSLDRINNDGNYEPGNLRFADNKTQGRNKRNNIFVEYQGQEMTLAEAAEKSGIDYKVLNNRYWHGKRGADLFKPVRNIK